MSAIINGDSPSITFSDGTTQATAFTTNPIVNNIKSQAATPLTFAINATEAMRIDSSGNLLINQTSLTGNGGGGTINATATTTTGNFFFRNSNASFSDSIFVLKSSGRTASSGFNYCYMLDSADAAQFYVRGDGVVFARNTSIQTISDARVKENVKDSSDGLNTIMGLRPIRFDYKSEYDPRKNQLGFIAQEVEKVFPDAIDEWKQNDKTFKSIGTATLIPVLVKAIQELNAKVDAQAAEIAELKAKP